MEETLTRIRKRTAKNLTFGRGKILEDFWPEVDGLGPIPSRKDFGLKENDPTDIFYAETLALFSSMFVTNVLLPENIPLLKPCPSIENPLPILRAKNKYKDKSDEELYGIALDIVMSDVRNCIAHGSFAFFKDKNERGEEVKFFVLVPTHSPFTADNYTIILPYEHIYNATAELIAKSLPDKNPQKCIESFKKMEYNTFAKKYYIPNMLFQLARFYKTGEIMPEFKDFCKKPATSVLMQYLFSSSIAAVNQSVCYEKFGKDSEIFKNLSFVRNSTAHNETQFLNENLDILLRDPGSKTVPPTQRTFTLCDIAFDLDYYNAQIGDNEALKKGLADLDKTK